MVIAGGLGPKAKELLDQHNIKVLVGAPQKPPEKLINDYLTGNLKLGENYCNH